jgi:hypothetical protein
MLENIFTPSWLSSFLLALFAAFLGSFIALKKYKKEKIWQEKYLAYQEILAAIEAMKLWADETYCEFKMIPQIGYNSQNDKFTSFSEALRCIAKWSCIGKLIISNGVVAILEKLEQEIRQEEFRYLEDRVHREGNGYCEEMAQHAQKINEIIAKYLPDAIKMAKKDLG